MSRNNLDLSEFQDAGDIISSLKVMGQRRERKATTSRSSHGKKLHLSEVEQEVEFKASASSSKSKTSVVVREHYYEVQLEVDHRDSRPRPPRELKHFSHRHPLYRYKLRKDDDVTCEICEQDFDGSAYGCDDCDYFLHKSCFDLPLEIEHKSHRDCTLTLRSTPAYKGGEFMCNACGLTGEGFNYRCSICKFDIHVRCASLPKTLNRGDKYPLTLFYSFPLKNEAGRLICDLCTESVDKKDYWVYYNRDSDCVCHVDCAFDEYADEDFEDPVLAIQKGLLRLEMK